MAVVAEVPTAHNGRRAVDAPPMPSPPEIAAGVLSHANGLLISEGLPVNEWKRLGAQLEATLSRALWSMGDWRHYGLRYWKDYNALVVQLDEQFYFAKRVARVAKAFPLERRRAHLSFNLHDVVASLPGPEQDRWLDDAIVLGWSHRELRKARDEARKAAAARAAVGLSLEEC